MPFTTMLLLSIPSLKTRYLKVFYFIFLISSICIVALKMELLFVASDSDLLISVLSFIYGYKVIIDFRLRKCVMSIRASLTALLSLKVLL